ncbi:MAG: hypothetical protein KGJ41_02750 [Rhodospirillales bacterium]|nr:hypothetical protein [Rhodospirillales bacterium]
MSDVIASTSSDGTSALDEVAAVGLWMAMESGVAAGIAAVSGDLALVQQALVATRMKVEVDPPAVGVARAAAVRPANIPEPQQATETPVNGPGLSGVPQPAPDVAHQAAGLPMRAEMAGGLTDRSPRSERVAPPSQLGPKKSGEMTVRILRGGGSASVPQARLLPGLGPVGQPSATPIRARRSDAEAAVASGRGQNLVTQSLAPAPALLSTLMGDFDKAPDHRSAAIAPVTEARAAKPSGGASAREPRSRGGAVDRPIPEVQPMRGDVYLDGALVGRWVEQHLTRAIGRPQNGSTAFDARMTPVWPGSLQGS